MAVCYLSGRIVLCAKLNCLDSSWKNVGMKVGSVMRHALQNFIPYLHPPPVGDAKRYYHTPLAFENIRKTKEGRWWWDLCPPSYIQQRRTIWLRPLQLYIYKQAKAACFNQWKTKCRYEENICLYFLWLHEVIFEAVALGRTWTIAHGRGSHYNTRLYFS